MENIQTYILNKTGSVEPYKVVDKALAHEQGLLHKSVHLLIISDGHILCRHRDSTEHRYPDLFTTTFGAHVQYGEDYQITIKNFLLNFSAQPTWIGEFLVKDKFENEINGLYIMKIEMNELPNNFLQNRNFFTKDELSKLIGENKTTPHLKEAFKMIANYI